MKKDSLTKQSLLLVCGRSLAYALNLALPILLVRIFSKDDYGMYRQLFLVFSTLLSIGQMGVSQSIYYFLPREPDKKDSLMIQTFAFVIGTGALSMAGLILFRQPIADAMQNSAMANYLPIMAVYTFFMIGACFLEISMIAEGNAKWASVVIVVSQIANSAILVIAALATRSILFVLGGAALFSVLRFGGQFYYLKNQYQLSLENLSPRFWKEQLAYAIPIGLGNVSWMLQGKLHQFFVSFLFNPAMFAVYSVGCFKLPILNIITSSVANIMTPAISKFQKDGDRASIIRIWNNSIRKMNLLIFPVFTFFLIMAGDFITLLFTRNYADSVPIFRVALLSMLVSAINTGAVLQAYAETRYIMKIALLRLPVTVAILYGFTHQWGVLGAVAADFSALVLFRFILLLKVRRLIDCTFFQVIDWRLNGRILLLSLLAGSPLSALNQMVHVPPSVSLVIALVVYLPIYIAGGLVSGIIKSEEKEALVDYIRAKIRSIVVYCSSFSSG